jgi:uncharacterized protein YajQ (UPF0234 family)
VADPSFDIVSKVDRQEVDNALNQASKEIATRYDFKDTGSSIAWSGETVEIRSNSDQRVKAVFEVFQEKLVKRGIPLKAVKHGDPQPAGGNTSRMVVELNQGISDDNAKMLAKKIRGEGPKGVQAQIQGDQLRVSGKKKDDLQAVIALLKDADLDIALQFTNYR